MGFQVAACGAGRFFSGSNALKCFNSHGVASSPVGAHVLLNVNWEHRSHKTQLQDDGKQQRFLHTWINDILCFNFFHTEIIKKMAQTL